MFLLFLIETRVKYDKYKNDGAIMAINCDSNVIYYGVFVLYHVSFGHFTDS